QFAVPIVLHPGVIDDELVVEGDRGAFANLDDAEAVPLPKGFVGVDERVAAGGLLVVVEEPATALVRPARPLAALLRGVPDLHLWRSPKVDATIGLGDGLVLDE